MIDKLCPPSCFHFVQVPTACENPCSLNNAGSVSISDSEFNSLDSEILLSEVYAALNGMKLSSSPGLNQFTYKVIKALSEEYLVVLTAIYNSLFREGAFPEQWFTLLLCWSQSHKAWVSDPFPSSHASLRSWRKYCMVVSDGLLKVDVFFRTFRLALERAGRAWIIWFPFLASYILPSLKKNM